MSKHFNGILFLVTGPAGAGKSTYARKMIEDSLAPIDHWEADMWMTDADGNYAFDPRLLKFCHGQCQAATKASMEAGRDVIVSNTTLTKKEAKPYIDLAKQHNYLVKIIHLNTQFQSIHNVPDWKIAEMQKRRERFSFEDFA